MFISIIITARYWRARGSCVVAVMRRATSLKTLAHPCQKFKGIIIITYAHAQLFMNFELVRVHERLRLTDKKDGAVPALAMVSFAGKTSS